MASLSFCLCLDGKIRLILTSFLLVKLSFVSYLLSIIKMFSRSFSYNNLNYFLIYIPIHIYPASLFSCTSSYNKIYFFTISLQIFI